MTKPLHRRLDPPAAETAGAETAGAETAGAETAGAETAAKETLVREVASTENHCGAGRRGEDQALSFLAGKGFHLLLRNYRHRRGEIDLVMEDPAKVLVFVEVKANRTSSAGHPLERIDGRKILRLQRLAQRYCWQFGQENRDMRFDVVGVDLPGDGSAPKVEHIVNAFLPDGANYHPPG